MGPIFGRFDNPWFDGEARADGYEPLLPGGLREDIVAATGLVDDFKGLVVDVRDPALAAPAVLNYGEDRSANLLRIELGFR